MRNCYDSLLSAAAATTNSAYGTSINIVFLGVTDFFSISVHSSLRFWISKYHISVFDNMLLLKYNTMI